MLTENQLGKLRSQIVLGSLYTNDYENTMGICPLNAQEFFDSYIEYCWDCIEEEDLDIQDLSEWGLYDNVENMYGWYEYYEDDPLPFDKVYAWMSENRIDFTVELYNNYCNQKDVILEEN